MALYSGFQRDDTHLQTVRTHEVRFRVGVRKHDGRGVITSSLVQHIRVHVHEQHLEGRTPDRDVYSTQHEGLTFFPQPDLSDHLNF